MRKRFNIELLYLLTVTSYNNYNINNFNNDKIFLIYTKQVKNILIYVFKLQK